MPLYVGDALKTATKTATVNSGNWACVFSPADIAVNLTAFECYRIVINGGPPGSTFQVYVNNKLYDSVFPGDVNSWDPNNSMKLANGDSVSFFWNSSTGTTGPTVVLYFQQAEVL